MADRRIQRFRVLEELGTGAMGTVVRAYDPQLEREVAIKVLQTAPPAVHATLSSHHTLDLRAGAAAASERRDDLLGEARMMARLSHPHVVPVYEAGLDGDAVFVVMELVAGGDLHAWLATPRPRPEIVRVFAEAARGLAAAHAHGIVHRDFKPANVLVGTDGRARVADFGLARLADRRSLVEIAESGGTPHFMAPELWRGASASPASDVYAFCKALVDALGGEATARAAGLARVLDGLAAAPATRPAIAELATLLGARTGGTRPRSLRTRLLVGATVLALAAGGGIAALASRARDCAALPITWERARHAAATQLAQPGADHLRARLDRYAAELVAGSPAACAAPARRACLERRAVELEVVLGRIARAPATLDDLATAIGDLPLVETCRTARAAPVRDRAALRALQGRLLARDAAAGARNLPALEALERDATTAGEVELAIRAAIAFGVDARLADRMTDSDAALARAYRLAVDIGADDLTATALLERSATAFMRNENAAGAQYAQLAKELARPELPPTIRARVLQAIGRASFVRGNYAAAEQELRAGLALVPEHGDGDPVYAIKMQTDLVHTLRDLGRFDDALTAADTNLAFVARHAGEQSLGYAIALTAKADVLARVRRFDESLRMRERALQLATALLPADNATVMRLRTKLAYEYRNQGEPARAIAEYDRVLAATANNEVLSGFHVATQAGLARALFQVGRIDEALKLNARVIDEKTARAGKDHPDTLAARVTRFELQLEVGHLAEAEREQAAVVAGYAAHPLPEDLRPTWLRGGLSAQLALARGQRAEALRDATHALAELVERAAPPALQRTVRETLVRAQLATGAFTDALATLDALAPITAAARFTEDVVAVESILRARAERGLGRHAQAIARAQAAREILRRHGSQPRALRDADELLARRP